jgi:hypothetical protein
LRNTQLKFSRSFFKKPILIRVKEKESLKAALCRSTKGQKQPAKESNTVKKRRLLWAPGVIFAEGKGEVNVDGGE